MTMELSRNQKQPNFVITFLPDLCKYRDRALQLQNEMPQDCKLIILTKKQCLHERAGSGMEIYEIGKGFLGRGPMLKLQLLTFILRKAGSGRVCIIDWFMNFNYVLPLTPLLGSRLIYIYAPVISHYGWFKKRLSRTVPFAGLRYDWIRFKSAIQDWLTVKFATKLMVQSKELVHWYADIYGKKGEKIFYNYNYSAPTNPTSRVINHQIDEDAPFAMGFIGNLELHKGLREMREVFLHLPKELISLQLAGTCKGKENAYYLRLLTELPNVQHLGRLNPNEVDEFYDRIGGLILLSYHEGSPRVIREFIDQRKPIFAFDHPGLDYCRDVPWVHLYKFSELHKVIADIKYTVENRNILHHYQINSFQIDRSNGLKEALGLIA